MKLCHFQENGTGNHHVEQSKTDSERNIARFFSYAENRPKEYGCQRVTIWGRGAT
jgi:hypothetical protein